MEDHPSSAVRGCLFNLFTATLHIGGRSSIRNLRTRHAVVTGTRQFLQSPLREPRISVTQPTLANGNISRISRRNCVLNSNSRQPQIRSQDTTACPFFVPLWFIVFLDVKVTNIIYLSFLFSVPHVALRCTSPHPLFHYFLDSQAKHWGHCKVYKGDKQEYSCVQQQTAAKTTI
jgi:hypothetical protein